MNWTPSKLYGFYYTIEENAILVADGTILESPDLITEMDICSVSKSAFAESEEKEFTDEMYNLFGEIAMRSYPITEFKNI